MSPSNDFVKRICGTQWFKYLVYLVLEPPLSWNCKKRCQLGAVTIQTAHLRSFTCACRCMFVEHKPLQVSEFRDISISEADRVTGHKGQSGSAAASGVVAHTQRRLESRR